MQKLLVVLAIVLSFAFSGHQEGNKTAAVTPLDVKQAHVVEVEQYELVNLSDDASAAVTPLDVKQR